MHVSLHVVNVTWTDLDILAFILHFLTCFGLWLVGLQICDGMAGSLSVASTTVSSAKVAAVDSGEDGRYAVYSRYNNCSRPLPWGTPALTGESLVYSVLTFTRKCLLCKYDFEDNEIIQRVH
jgi:hypothetical protein